MTREVPMYPTCVFRAVYYFHFRFFTDIFSNCLTIGYASFDAKKKKKFLANKHKLALLRNIKKIVLDGILKWNISMLFQLCKIYSCSSTLSQISLKASFGKMFFFFFFSSFGQNRNDANKNQLFGRHFETVHCFKVFFFFRIMIF